MRIGLFATCLVDTLFPQTGIATVRLLERLGHEVEFPRGQTCCGQLHLNSGYEREARVLAARLPALFAAHDLVVVPSASCAGTVRELCPALAPRVRELTEVLTPADVHASFPYRVAYHPTCHSLRALRLGERPLELLRAVEGLELVEIPAAEECCGFGGTFAVKNADTSNAMLADKLAAIEQSGAEVVTAVDRSCLMHLGGALARRGTVRTMHLAEILA